MEAEKGRKRNEMTAIYRVQISGRLLESKNLKRLLSRAVREKRNLDRRFRAFTEPVPDLLAQNPNGHHTQDLMPQNFRFEEGPDRLM